MQKNTISTKAVLMGTVFAGLAMGMVMGFTQIINTTAAQANEGSQEAEGAIGVSSSERSATDAQLDNALESARDAQDMITGEDASVEFVAVAPNPYITDGVDENGHKIHTKQVLEHVGDDGLSYTVDKESGQVMQIGPGLRKEGDPAPERDYTERYTKEELETLAIKFAEDMGVDVDSVTEGIDMQVFTKDGRGYFFRWEDTSNRDEMRFLQVGLTVGGSLLSYVNTLEI